MRHSFSMGGTAKLLHRSSKSGHCTKYKRDSEQKSEFAGQNKKKIPPFWGINSTNQRQGRGKKAGQFLPGHRESTSAQQGNNKQLILQLDKVFSLSPSLLPPPLTLSIREREKKNSPVIMEREKAMPDGTA